MPEAASDGLLPLPSRWGPVKFLSRPTESSGLPVQVMKKKAKAGKGKQAGKMLTKTEPVASFFNFFSPPQEPEEDAEMEEEDIEELREALEADFELG